MPPGWLLSPEAWRGVAGAPMPDIPNVRPPPGFESNAEFVSGLPSFNPLGMFGRRTVGGYPVGTSSPATWNPAYGGPTFGNAPPAAVAAGVPPSIAPSAVDEGAPPGEPVTTGPPMPMPTFFDTVLGDYAQATRALPGLPGMSGYDRSATNAGFAGMRAAGMDSAAARRATATVIGEGEKALGDLSAEKGAYLEDDSKQEGQYYDASTKEYGEWKDKHDTDVEWLRTHTSVDPYRKFTTNAGAGILALLGTGLMAAGAGMRSDTSMEWTKQIDNLLGREADQQMKMIKNTQFAASESGKNMQRILDTSKDRFEARTRFKLQHLAGLSEKAEAIKHGTESKAVASRAEEFIADNNERIARGLADIGIRREGLGSQESIARLSTNLGLRDQEVRLLLGLTGTAAQREHALLNLQYQRAKPVIDATREIDKDFAMAASAGKALREALLAGKSGAQLNALASPFAQALAKAMSGGGGAAAPLREEVRAYGIPTNFDEALAKLQAMDANDVAALMQHLNTARDDKKMFLYQGYAEGFNPPPNAVYSSPPGKVPVGKAPAKGAPAPKK